MSIEMRFILGEEKMNCDGAEIAFERQKTV